ncbi:MAG: ISAzo13 family transposase, partial [Thermoplasmata archaeon]
PYGVYDLTRNSGWVRVGIDHDTASFVVTTIRRWWQKMGRVAYPNATSLLITADCGGSNNARSRRWKLELQRWANRTGLTLGGCHFPPGTSKWNKIEHRLFSFITQNWRGRPLTSLATIVSRIGATRTRTGRWVRAELDPGKYPKGRKISEEEMSGLPIVPDSFHGEWNYAIVPKRQQQLSAALSKST